MENKQNTPPQEVSEFSEKANEIANNAMELCKDKDNQAIFIAAIEKHGDKMHVVNACVANYEILKCGLKSIIKSDDGGFFASAIAEALVECKIESIVKSSATDFVPKTKVN